MKLIALWPSRPINKVKNQYPQNAPKMNFYYEIHIWMAPTWQPFEDLLAKMFLKPSLKLAASCHCSRYEAKQRGLAALILLSKVVGFFGSKVSYICLLYPTGCEICSDEIFLKTTTLMSHAHAPTYVDKRLTDAVDFECKYIGSSCDWQLLLSLTLTILTRSI